MQRNFTDPEKRIPKIGDDFIQGCNVDAAADVGYCSEDNPKTLKTHAISPFHEMGAYEFLWSEHDTTFKSLSKGFARHPGSVPSDFVSSAEARECAAFVTQ